MGKERAWPAHAGGSALPIRARRRGTAPQPSHKDIFLWEALATKRVFGPRGLRKKKRTSVMSLRRVSGDAPEWQSRGAVAEREGGRRNWVRGI